MKKALLVLAFALLGFSTAYSQDNSASKQTDMSKTLTTLSKNSGVSTKDLADAISKATLQQSIIKAMNRPGEAKPWHEYRKIFIIEKRVTEGRQFWQKNQTELERAASYFHVAPEIVIAIIGIETFYGKHMGTYKVLDALYTLGFHYPARAKYFQGEFANFVKLAKQQKWQLTEPKGSYAGAMGMGQFMPYSYLTWAVDFNNDGHIDLFTSTADAIGSVANYFKEHGWHEGEDVIIPLDTAKAKVTDATMDTYLTSGIDLTKKVADFRALGITIPKKYADNTKVKLVKLEQPNGNQYILGLHNFRVIMTYNKSPRYAMAAYELSKMVNPSAPMPVFPKTTTKAKAQGKAVKATAKAPTKTTSKSAIKTAEPKTKSKTTLKTTTPKTKGKTTEPKSTK